VKLLCLEVLIVSIATRAMLALIGKPPPLPDVVWGSATLAAAVVAIAILILDAVKAARIRRTVYPPHIPLGRIGPYRRDRIAARADRGRNVTLN
jgi:hypothetical protein